MINEILAIAVCEICVAEAERKIKQQAADALEAKAAPVGELWAVHAQGPDDIYPAFSRDDAERHAAELNGLTMPEGIAISAVVIQSPLPAAEHWKCLAEQEREQCEAIQARAARQRQQAREVVVMPKQKLVANESYGDSPYPHFAKGWNACLDEIARLNKGAGSHE